MEETQKKLMGVVESLGTAKFEVPDVKIMDIIARMDAKDESLVLLDIRSEEETAVSTIPGSISKVEFDSDPAKYADKEVVCFCTVGYISGFKTCEYRRQGMTNVKNMGDGAILGYTLARTAAGVKMPLVKQDGTPTNEVHTFMDTLCPLAGEGMVGISFADPSKMN
jgi:rhodanese-related sulfurtransferase